MMPSARFSESARRFNSRVGYFVPHSFLFVILLTFLAYFLGVFITYQGPFDMVRSWVNGVWNLLAFSMQMVLLVAAGFSVASAPPSQSLLGRLASLFRTPRRAVLAVTALTAFCSFIHWGLGIIAGSFLAREMGRRVTGVDYPLVVAGAFIGMGAGNFGMFAADPLVIREAGHFLARASEPPAAGLGPLNPATVIGLLWGVGAVLLFMSWICPEGSKASPPAPELLERFEREDRAEEVSLAAEREIRRRGGKSFGMWLEHSRWPVWLLSLMAFSYIVFWFYGRGFVLNLNLLIFILFALALSLHDSPLHFLKSMESSARAAHGIIIQFPFYAGIQGMLSSSGLPTITAGWISSWASAATYPTLLYLHTILLNFFAPTSGSVWEIQGALAAKAAQGLSADLPRSVQALLAGEILGNVIHPFWAIPLMGICGLSIRDILGYCLLAFVLLSAIWVVCINFLPL